MAAHLANLLQRLLKIHRQWAPQIEQMSNTVHDDYTENQADAASWFLFDQPKKRCRGNFF
jgi:hypothetical protein